MNIAVFGRQGSGKGTQCTRLAKKLGVVHVSTGDVLRNTEAGLEAKSKMDAGELIDDSVMNGIVAERLAARDVVENGFVLDGYPRNMAQLSFLASLTSLDAAVLIEVPIEEVTNRMLARGREDDTVDSIARRLGLYDEETAPVLEWLSSRGILRSVDGSADEGVVTQRILQAISD